MVALYTTLNQKSTVDLLHGDQPTQRRLAPPFADNFPLFRGQEATACLPFLPLNPAVPLDLESQIQFTLSFARPYCKIHTNALINSTSRCTNSTFQESETTLQLWTAYGNKEGSCASPSPAVGGDATDAVMIERRRRERRPRGRVRSCVRGYPPSDPPSLRPSGGQRGDDFPRLSAVRPSDGGAHTNGRLDGGRPFGTLLLPLSPSRGKASARLSSPSLKVEAGGRYFLQKIF